MRKTRAGPRHVTLHSGLPLIETADKLELDMLVADKSVGPHILTRLSDTVAVIAPGHFDQVLARLRKLGHSYIPKAHAEALREQLAWAGLQVQLLMPQTDQASAPESDPESDD